MKTLAVINLGPIGDVVNASPVCIEIKKKYPDSKLIFVVAEISANVAECLPGVDKVIVFDRYYKHKGLKILQVSLPLLLKHRVDAAFLLTDNIRSALFAFLMGARKIIGRNCDGRGIFLSHKIPFLEEEQNLKIHVSEQYMRVLKPLNLYNPDYKFGFRYLKNDEDYINSLISNSEFANSKLIGLCPCSGREFKDWTPKITADFIRYINNNTNYKVVIIGQENTKQHIEQVRKLGVNDFLDLSRKTSISQLGALIHKFERFVSVDSAPMHIAFALEVPTLALFFQPNYEKWGPVDSKKHKLLFDWSRIPAQKAFEEFQEFDKRQNLNLI